MPNETEELVDDLEIETPESETEGLPEIDDGEDESEELPDLPEDDEPETPLESDPGDETDPEPEPAPKAEKPKATPQPGIDEDRLKLALDRATADYAKAYEEQTGFAPMDNELATFRYMEDRRIRSEVAAKVQHDARRISELKGQRQVYEAQFARLGNQKAADHFIAIIEENGPDVLDDPRALQAAKDMALGRAIREQGGVKPKPNLPKGQPPGAKDSGYTAAERQALKEMRQSGLNPKTRKELREWMTY